MTYYQILGVARDATQDEIKAAFRLLSKELHPDIGGDTERQQQANEAYGILSDPDKRAAYDNGEAPPDMIKSQAKAQLLQMFLATIEQVENPCVNDLVGCMREMCEYSIDESESQCCGLVKQIQKLEAIKSRLNGSALISDAIDKQIEVAERSIRICRSEILVVEAVLEMLGAITYEVDGSIGSVEIYNTAGQSQSWSIPRG